MALRSRRPPSQTRPAAPWLRAREVTSQFHTVLTSAVVIPSFFILESSVVRLATRTLHRHLAAEDTTFRLLVGEVRGALAEGMLSHRMTVAEVAERLGYAEVASFSRAFKRWKGTPPSAYRARA